MIKAYYVIRKDLNMSPAKLAVQVGHGTQLLMLSENYEFLQEWKEISDSRKIVCEISSEQKLSNLKDILSTEFDIEEIWDSGYTEFGKLTFTGIAFLIREESLSPTIINKLKRLQLYK